MATTAATSANNPASNLYAALNGTANSKSAKSTSQADAAQSRFLKLLTTQLKNQDPLNPLDNAQMTSQLAQISTVDGIERLNATLQSLISDSSNSQTLQAAALVGHGVLIPGSSVGLEKGAAFGGVELAADADAVTVNITDSNGLLMRSMSLGSVKAGAHTFNWDGNTDAGVAAAEGNYSFTVTAQQGSKAVDATALALGLVTSVTRNSSGIGVNVGQQTYALADVRQIL
jgi:flagellar basal-body rod modification protein FlgD